MKKSIALLFSVLMISPFFTSEAEVNQPMTIAHRGASYDAPEHTFAAYDLGIRQRAEVIEIDLQMTKDGHVVAFHDDTLDRTTNGTGRVYDKTLAELKQLDAGSWFNKKYPERARKAYINERIRTLDEILDRYGHKTKLNIEMKTPEHYPGMEDAVFKSLKRSGLLVPQTFQNRSIIVESFTPSSLKKLKSLAPGLSLNQSIWKRDINKYSDSDLQQMRAYADSVSINYKVATKETVDRYKKFGFNVRTYTVDKSKDLNRLSEYGLTGIYTNRPGLHIQLKSQGQI